MSFCNIHHRPTVDKWPNCRILPSRSLKSIRSRCSKSITRHSIDWRKRFVENKECHDEECFSSIFDHSLKRKFLQSDRLFFRSSSSNYYFRKSWRARWCGCLPISWQSKVCRLFFLFHIFCFVRQNSDSLNISNSLAWSSEEWRDSFRHDSSSRQSQGSLHSSEGTEDVCPSH